MIDPKKYFEIMRRKFSEEKLSELYYKNEFTFAVAVILSAQATDKQVNKITPPLFKIADTPEKMAKLGATKLKKYINTISFFNNKARHIVGASKALIKTGGKLPRDRDELMKLPGIGRKTANVIMNVLWDAPVIGVDTHLFRLAHRFGWSRAKTPEKVELDLEKIIPSKYHAVTNHVMVMHGRYICKAIKPDCINCPVRKLCKIKRI
ncbi:MAG: endonuclease III [Alphaproteobacteria bacterium]|nr:endonuclease III [Alphaproteobacteria bacterium]